MDYNTITDLLDKYWEGNSSLEEEKQLKQYFSSDEVSAEHQDLQSFFRSLDQSAQLEVSEDFDDRFFAQIDALEETPQTQGRIVRFPRFARYAAAAAVVLMSLFAIQQYVQSDETPQELAVHEIEDPEVALEETLKALRLLGANLKKGEKQTDKALSSLQSAKSAVR